MKHYIILYLSVIVLLLTSCGDEIDWGVIPPERYESELLVNLYEGDHYIKTSVPAEGTKDIIGKEVSAEIPGLLIGAGAFDGEPDYDEIRHRGFQDWHHHTVYSYTTEQNVWEFDSPWQDFRVYSLGDFKVTNWDSGWAKISLGPNKTGKTRYFYVEFGFAYNTPDTDGLRTECQYCKDHPDEVVKETPEYLYYPANLRFKTIVIGQPPLKEN